MASIIKRFNAKAGISVGLAPVNVIDDQGNITGLSGAFSATTASTSPTTGAVVVAGGVGVGGNLNVGGSISIGGALSVTDATFLIVDNGDVTKAVQFEVSGVDTATIRTLTVPNANGTIALLSNKLSNFAATTSAELASVISDETGSGALVFANTPTLLTPVVASLRGDAGALELKPNAADTTGTVTISATTASTNASTGALVVAGGVGVGGNVNITGNTIISGNLTVSGTTTTVNSTVVSIKDPIFALGDDTLDDNKDRGIEFKYNDGVDTKIGFFGFKDSNGHFTFIPDATNTSEVFSGTPGIIDADLNGLALRATNLAGGGAGYIPYQSAAGTTAFLAAGTAGQVLLSGGVAAPTWADYGAFNDENFQIVDNVDNTKVVKFQVSGVSTATTRTLTVQNADGTIALLGNKLSDFVATTSAELASVISDETGSGALVFANTPTLLTPVVASLRGDAGALELKPNAADTTGTVNVSATTASTSTTTGALTVAGGVGIAGDLHVSTVAAGTVDIGYAAFTSTTTTATLNATTVVSSTAATAYTTHEYTIQAKQATTNYIRTLKIFAVCDGTDVAITEYADIDLGTIDGTLSFTVVLNSGNIELRATQTGATNAFTIKVLAAKIDI